MNIATSEESVYRIGAVSRLTGIPTATLRMWERRYTIVLPDRENGTIRHYTRTDINRLKLIKQLVDRGHSISTVANLKLEDLQERLNNDAAIAQPKQTNNGYLQFTPRLAILGESITAKIIRKDPGLEGLDIIITEVDPNRFQQSILEIKPDILVVEYTVVRENTLNEIRDLLQRSCANKAIVIYGIGQAKAVHKLNTYDIVPLRAPIELTELKRTCLALFNSAPHPALYDNNQSITTLAPPRRFDNEALATIAARSNTLRCECPRHIVELILSLLYFEAYSKECESTNQEDANLHTYLYATTAQARSMIENALARLIEAEGIDLDAHL